MAEPLISNLSDYHADPRSLCCFTDDVPLAYMASRLSPEALHQYLAHCDHCARCCTVNLGLECIVEAFSILLEDKIPELATRQRNSPLDQLRVQSFPTE